MRKQMSYLHQAETNVVAHRMSSAEEAKWRDWDVDPELLYNPTPVTNNESFESSELLEQSAHRPLSVQAAARVMKTAEVQVQNPATAAVNLSFNVGRL
jgi:hypothetical protein